MQRTRSQLTIAAVALLLGILVVVQLRAQTAGSGLDTLSATELTTLVANLNTRNDQLRGEIATLQLEYEDLAAAGARGQTSIGQVSTDLARIRTWSGLAGARGSRAGGAESSASPRRAAPAAVARPAMCRT